MMYSNGVFYESRRFIRHNRKLTFKGKIKHLLKTIRYPFLQVSQICILFVIKLFKKRNYYNKKYPLVLVSIFKNEARFLKEWINYYNIIGVDHFFLFNNNSNDNFIEILQSYIEKGIVTLIEWPDVPGQLSAYQFWWDNYRKDCGYASFIDLDEYICPIYDSDLKSWIDKHHFYPVIKMDWLMFGSSALQKHDDSKFIIEQYDSCWNKRLSIGKVIFDCSFNSNKLTIMCMHMLCLKYGIFKLYPFNDTGFVCQWEYLEYCKNKHTIQLNHYYSKAYDILQEKIKRGSAAHSNNWKASEKYMLRENMNVKKNYTIQRFLLQLKNNEI